MFPAIMVCGVSRLVKVVAWLEVPEVNVSFGLGIWRFGGYYSYYMLKFRRLKDSFSSCYSCLTVSK